MEVEKDIIKQCEPFEKLPLKPDLVAGLQGKINIFSAKYSSVLIQNRRWFSQAL